MQSGLRHASDYRSLPPAAKQIVQADRRQPIPAGTSSPDRALDASLAWLGRAQDQSSTKDGGVARHFNIVGGWGPSYPETTGYIVPTVIDEAARAGDEVLITRARRMLDWLVAIQLPEGAFQGGTINAPKIVPVTFNTGQILLGLSAGVTRFPEVQAYSDAMHAAARWLVDTQDHDGGWRRYPTPFAEPGEKAYETHVAWGLFEAERAAPGNGYGEAGLRQVRWALKKQRANGWFEDNCLTDPSSPLTHTIGYALRGLVEAWRLSGDRGLYAAAMKTASALIGVTAPDGRIPACLDENWRPVSATSCLTGSVQIAACWFLLAAENRDEVLTDAARRAVRYVRSTIATSGDPDRIGGVRGSYPIDGPYGQYEFLNWAAKFFIDAQRMEMVAAA